MALTIDFIQRQMSFKIFNSYKTMYEMQEFGHCGHPNHPFDWSHLPLKKRPIKEIYIQENFISPFKTYKCSECGKIFFNGVRYRAHLRRHESKKSGRYGCRVCGKTFVQRSSLTTHLRIHSGEKPFFCTECFDRFGDFSTFTKHKRIHSGEKPYACPVCHRSFSQSGNMHRHLKAVHRSDGSEQIAVNRIPC